MRNEVNITNLHMNEMLKYNLKITIGVKFS